MTDILTVADQLVAVLKEQNDILAGLKQSFAELEAINKEALAFWEGK